MKSTSTTTDLAHFINVACIIWSKRTSWARDVNSRDRDVETETTSLSIVDVNVITEKKTTPVCIHN